jgi:hypothetical protein
MDIRQTRRIGIARDKEWSYMKTNNNKKNPLER